jgi:hypothetical protein
MTVLTFQPRFAPLVIAGTKSQTVRGVRKRPIKVGDRLSLRRWTGRPYASKQEMLREAVCVETAAVNIGRAFLELMVNDVELDDAAANDFARRDGFADYSEMLDWFENVHGLPFAGVLIRWAP